MAILIARNLQRRSKKYLFRQFVYYKRERKKDMSIIYIISVLVLFITAILVKKKAKKQIDTIKTIFVSIMLYLCYNTLICYVFTTLTFPFV